MSLTIRKVIRSIPSKKGSSIGDFRAIYYDIWLSTAFLKFSDCSFVLAYFRVSLPTNERSGLRMCKISRSSAKNSLWVTMRVNGLQTLGPNLKPCLHVPMAIKHPYSWSIQSMMVKPSGVIEYIPRQVLQTRLLANLEKRSIILFEMSGTNSLFSRQLYPQTCGSRVR
jgi:hypothetical protein